MRLNRFLLFTISALVLSITSFAQTTYYVDQQNGSDANNGTSVSTAFETFDEAEGAVSAGDTIEIIGEYTNSSYNSTYSFGAVNDAHLWNSENTIRIHNLNGSSGNYITIKPYNSNTLLKGDGANIFRVTSSSYLKIEGFNMQGEVDNIPLSTANALQFVYLIDDGTLQGTSTAPHINDINYRNEDETNDNDNIVEETDTYTDIGSEPVVRPSYIDTRGLYISNCNNIEISNNTIHHTPGGGLRVSDSKFIDIVGNEIYRCSAKSYSGTHALVVTKTEPIESSDYSINILKNKIHHNYNEQYSWAPTKTIITPRIDEGKGISLQRNNTSTWINGSGRILVANNLCYWNGFSGVHSNDGYRIDFINNTCYLNSYTNTVTYAGVEQNGKNIGVSAQSSNDIKMINNISVIDTDWNGFALSAGGTTNLEVSDNMIFGYNGNVSQDSDITNIDVNTTIDNPLFVDADNFDFNLQATSPVIGIANTAYAPTDDFFGFSRDANPDLGAIEYGATLSNNDFVSTKFKVFPNPSSNYVNISGNTPINSIELYSVLGQKIKLNNTLQLNKKTNRVDLNNLDNGLYLLKINDRTIKLIKK